ncbi:hypothetical protein [Lampropedia aestuarii]|uniref:hypothetical protein n=1 Tax=Lampropedia aestuarii TaxID=2562762 RepID=UPI0014560FDE|nr:hypothetical protein [Lampropedia aestuarii]
MSLSTVTHIAAATLAGVLVWLFQSARLGADLADERLQSSKYRHQATIERAAANARVAKASADVAANYQEVLNDAIAKQAALQADATRARRESYSLRKQLTDAEQRLADASAATLIEYASTTNQLLGECSSEYTALAEKADGHAADAATCRAAWPVIPQTKEKFQ